MKRIIRKCLCVFTAAAVMLGSIGAAQVPVWAAKDSGQKVKAGRAAVREAVTVTTTEAFMEALRQNKSPITVDGDITIDNVAETSGRMRPVMIPANTEITGTAGSAITSRSPIQLQGDGVSFRNIKLTFSSTDSLGSVPHREIFLAGHSLTLDKVSTYRPGGNGKPGSYEGTEKELLPTVYGGGYPGSYPGTSLGTSASLTVRNSNDNTIFQAINMGNSNAREDGEAMMPYSGNAVLILDAKTTVRDKVNTSLNSKASINITGMANQWSRAKQFYGNKDTTLTIGASVDAEAVENVGNIMLEEKAYLAPKTRYLQNITLKSGACLDFNGTKENEGAAKITGNFSAIGGSTGERAVLVLNQKGSLSIDGTVTGTTQFQTGNRYFSVSPSEKQYISAKEGNCTATSFVLSPNLTANYQLEYSAGAWSVSKRAADYWEISRIEITSAPSTVNLNKILQNGSQEPNFNENPYFGIKWYDGNGVEFRTEEVEENGLYGLDYVIGIKTDYWDTNNFQGKNDWFQPISLRASDAYSGYYFLEDFNGSKAGDYTFLFCSDYADVFPSDEGEPDKTVAEVKRELEGKVKATVRVTCHRDDNVQDHIHSYQSKITKSATCTEAGIRTYSCSCGKDTYTEPIPALGHKAVKVPAVPPTETKPGTTEGVRCSTCNAVLQGIETIPPTGTGTTDPTHGTTTPTTKPPTTAPTSGTTKPTTTPTGSTTKPTTAPTTGETATPPTEPTTTPPTEPSGDHKHQYQSSVTKQATCTEEGIRTYTCACGHTYTEPIAPSEHQYEEERIPATGKTDGKVQKVCKVCSHITDVYVISRPRNPSWSKAEFTYDGKTKTPEVSIRDTKGNEMVPGADYEVLYPKAMKNPGIYTVVVEFCGDYSGRVTKTITIKPRKASLKKAVSGSKRILITWNRQTVQIDGYQVQYSRDKAFKGKTSKTVTVKKNAAGTTIKKLKGKTKYYVRVRTYKNVKVSGKSKKLYSDWSGKKAVYTKR